MSFITSKRGRVTALVTAAVALVASMLTVAPAQAAPAAVNMSYGNIDRDTTGSQFVIGIGETVRLYTSATLNSSYFGDHAITGSTVFTVTLPVVPLPAGVTAASTTYMWSAYGSGACNPAMGSSASYTVTDTCVTNTYVSAGTSYTNGTGSEVTVTFDDANSAILRDGVTTVGMSGSSNNQYATKSLSSANGFSIRSDGEDTHLSGSFTACLSAARTTDEHLTVSFDITVDGVTQTVFDGEDNMNGAMTGDIEAYISDGGTSTSALEFIVPTGSSTSTTITRRINVNTPASGAWIATMSVKDSDGNLVAGSCSGGGGGGMAPTTYPSDVTAHDSSVTTLPFGQITKTIGANLTSLTTATSTDDGSGGKLYAAVASGTTATVIQITPTGVNSKFAKNGKASITGVSSINSLAVYNTKKNWAAMSGNPMLGYKIHTGTFAASTVTTKSVTSANLTKACGGTGYASMGVQVMSSAVTLPLATVYCTKTSNNGSFSVIAKITPTSGAVTKIVQLGNPGTGDTAPCVIVSSGTNPAATGSNSTYIAYVATGTGSDPSCMGLATITKREIVFVSAAGAGSTKAIASNPWGSTLGDEPTRSFFAPGKTAGTWIGAGMLGGSMSPPTGTRMFSVSAAKAITVKGVIAIDDAALSGLMYPTLYPVKEISSGKWSFRAETWGSSKKFVLLTAVPATGVITVGETLTVTGTGNNPRQIINATAWSSDGKLRHYVLTDPNTVKITTWNSVTS